MKFFNLNQNKKNNITYNKPKKNYNKDFRGWCAPDPRPLKILPNELTEQLIQMSYLFFELLEKMEKLTNSYEEAIKRINKTGGKDDRKQRNTKYNR